MPGRPRVFHHVDKSLRVKITLGVVLPLAAILAIFAIIENDRQHEIVLYHLTASASRSAEVLENSLRHAMMQSDFSEIQSTLNLINNTEEFRVVYLLDTSGKIIFASDSTRVDTRLNNMDPGCLPCHSKAAADRPGSIIVKADDGQSVFRSMYPIKNSPECQACHDPEQKIVGLILTDVPVAPVEEALQRDFRKDLYWWAGVILVTALIANFSMDSLVVKRLGNLALALRSFGQGQRAVRLNVVGEDEVSQLAQSFNEMGRRIENDEAEKQKLSLELISQNAQRSELLKSLITAQEDERRRVARELHDDLGQALSALSLQVQTLEKLVTSNPAEANDKLNEIGDLISDASERMYDLIFALRPSVLDEFGLMAAVRNHAGKSFDGTEITYSLELDGDSGRLPPEMEVALYRVIQEALSNVKRHSHATHMDITLKLKEGVFMGEISDNGIGFDPGSIDEDGNHQRGLGLLSMRERISQYNGQVEILSRYGGGTVVRIKLFANEDKNG